jgi:hypothetical protein
VTEDGCVRLFFLCYHAMVQIDDATSCDSAPAPETRIAAPDYPALAHQNMVSSPFCRAPFDILQIILHLVVSSHYPLTEFSNSMDGNIMPAAIPLAVFSICTAIRTAALASPIVWSYIHGNASSEWMHLCEERAQLSPLAIFINMEKKKDLSAVLALVGRARQVHVFASGAPAYYIDANTYTLVYAPRIRSLVWHCSLEQSLRLLQGPDNLSTSLLTRLHLQHIRLSTATKLPSLISLQLLDLNVDNLMDLITSIANSPLLERIHLGNVTASGLPFSRTLVLDHLKDLKIEAQTWITTMILRTLPHPSQGVDLHVTTSKRMARDPSELELQQEIFQYIRPLIIRVQTPLVCLQAQLWELRLCENTKSFPHRRNLKYSITCPSLRGLQPYLNTLTGVHLHGFSGHSILGRMLSEPSEWLPDITKVIFSQHRFHKMRDRLEGYLRARSEGGFRIGTLQILTRGQPMIQTAEEFRQTVETEQLVDTMCSDDDVVMWKRPQVDYSRTVEGNASNMEANAAT